MRSERMRYPIFLVAALCGLIPAALSAAGPQPGDVYREFHVVMGGPGDWRVNDPLNPKSPRFFLPNPALRLTISDLKGARRAEVQLDRWGGHVGTIEKRLRFNGQGWINIPELATTPPGQPPQCFPSQDNPIVEVPLSHLREGENTLEGLSGGQTGGCGSNWGQWGWYGAVVRVYYQPSARHVEGRIVSPAPRAVLKDQPVVEVSARGPSRVDRVDVLAFYDGFDEDGDGVFEEWHYAYRHTELVGHAGTAMSPPFKVRWDTTWVPDQAPGSIKLLARIRDSSGLWYVSPAVEGLTLKRSAGSVKLFKPRDVPLRYLARNSKTVSSKVTVPASEPLDKAVQAVVALRTWNGLRDDFRFNDHVAPVKGADHKYAYALREVPVAAVRPGENVISFHSTSKAHGIEILWPGPALLIRYGTPAPPPATTGWVNPNYAARIPIDLETSVPLEADKPVEIDLNFTEALRQAGVPGAFDDRSIRVVDNDQRGVTDAGARWQFDRAPDYDASRNAAGTLTVLIKPMPAGWARRLMVYFATAETAAPHLLTRPLVRVTDETEHRGQASVRVSTQNGEYVYHKEGAGFASLYDREGNDWISYEPGKGSAGEFRGIPNMGAWFHPGYTGQRGARTVVESRGPLKARLRSESQDGSFACVWDFFPVYARMTLQRAGQPYWFLYEGTPGGKLDPDGDFWVASDGTRRPAGESWEGNLPSPEWVYFGDATLKRALFLANHQNDAVIDQSRQMESNMTVFGFGRRLRGLQRHMTAAPARFTIGFVETKDFANLINSAWSDPKVKIGRAEARP